MVGSAVTSLRPGVSRCCASHFSCLPKRSNQEKGTLHCVDASHRCLALRARKGAAGTRCAQTSGGFSPSALCCSAQRQGVEYKPNTNRAAEASCCFVGFIGSRVSRREAQCPSPVGRISRRRNPTGTSLKSVNLACESDGPEIHRLRSFGLRPLGLIRPTRWKRKRGAEAPLDIARI